MTTPSHVAASAPATDQSRFFKTAFPRCDDSPFSIDGAIEPSANAAHSNRQQHNCLESLFLIIHSNKSRILLEN
ncbi:hypothetical protein [Rhodoferax sp.]|uniref:hypothetical protein n=1 Tax=Rhodoferax sp. TaxID=50421 RepID=UPI002624A38F|nr:hypothetical protein [Rhodoferax sp.]MDD2924658.1 hypothetical protein [Rhodoferax sp.]